jgi:hypothetical protein
MADDPQLSVQQIRNIVDRDIDATQAFDVATLNGHVNTCVSLCRQALEKCGLAGFGNDEKAHFEAFIDGMRHSHDSIRKLLRGEQSPSAVEALTIARLQVENVYSICFLLQSPKNLRLFLKNNWKKKYVRFLLEREELAHLPRFADYYSNTGLESLGKLQAVSSVTDEERRTIDIQQLGYPFGPKPQLVRMPDFPTPGGVIREISNLDQKKMLSRLYPEYEYLCSFAHGNSNAVFFKTMADVRSPHHREHPKSQIDDFYQTQILEPPIIYSGLSTVVAATEIAAVCPASIELRTELIKAWNFLTSTSILTFHAWQMRAKRVLGIVGE